MKSFCVFGDSVAKGVIFDVVSKKYSTTKQSCVELFKSVTGSSVRNLSHFGSTIIRAKNLIDRHENEFGHYDEIVLEFGGNDCDHNWAAIAENPQAQHFPNVPLEQFKKKYCEIIDNIRAQGGVPVMTTLPPLDARRFFDWVSRGLDRDAILLWLKDIEYIYRWQELYNLAVNEVANVKNVRLIDIRREFLSKRDIGDYICIDGMHPNEEGHKLIANALCRSYQEMPNRATT